MRTTLAMAVLVAASLLPIGATAGDNPNAQAKAEITKAERARIDRLNYAYANRMWWANAGQIGTRLDAPTLPASP